MWTRLDPCKLFGSLIYSGKNNYYRVDLKQEETKNPKHKRVLMYSPGCFFVIQTKTKSLKIRYKVHYRRTSQEYFPLKYGAEVVVFAKINDNWEILNHWQDTIKDAGGLNVSYEKMDEEQTYTLSFDLKRVECDMFQICLPTQGKILNIEVESDSQINQLYENPKLIIAGSSIAACTATSPSHSLFSMAYRKYGINLINCGISGDHTFNCVELMEDVQKLNIPVLTVDLLHLNEARFLKYFNKKNFIYYITTPVAVQYERFNVKKHIKSENIAKITGEGHTDITHLNSSGISYYLQQLKKKGII